MIAVLRAAAGMFDLVSIFLFAAFHRGSRYGAPAIAPSPHGSPGFFQAPIANIYSPPPVAEPQYEEVESNATTPETVVITSPQTPTARPLRRSSRIAACRVPYGRRPLPSVEEQEDSSGND